MQICDLNCEIEDGKLPSLRKTVHIIQQDDKATKVPALT